MSTRNRRLKRAPPTHTQLPQNTDLKKPDKGPRTTNTSIIPNNP